MSFSVFTDMFHHHLQSILEHFHHLKSNPFGKKKVNLITFTYHPHILPSPLQPLAAIILLCVSVDLPILDFPMNAVVQYVVSVTGFFNLA